LLGPFGERCMTNHKSPTNPFSYLIPHWFNSVIHVNFPVIRKQLYGGGKVLVFCVCFTLTPPSGRLPNHPFTKKSKAGTVYRLSRWRTDILKNHMITHSEGMSWVVSVSLPPDQSNACTEHATSLSGRLSGLLSGLIHPTGYVWGKIKTNA